jgi:hypothetical protein
VPEYRTRNANPLRAVHRGLTYQQAHFGRFVKLGATRITSSGTDAGLMEVAFRNPDGSLAVVVCNNTDATRTTSVSGNGVTGAFYVYQSTSEASMMVALPSVAPGADQSIPPRSITTFSSWQPTTAARTVRATRPMASAEVTVRADSRIRICTSEETVVALSLYTARGELAGRMRVSAPAGDIVLDPRAADGKALAAAQYLARVSVTGVSGRTTHRVVSVQLR